MFGFLLCPSLAASARADEYRDNERHFVLQLPPGWRSIPLDVLRTVNAEAQQRAPEGKIRYTAGFQPIARPIPYILIQPTELPGSTYDEIERFFLV